MPTPWSVEEVEATVADYLHTWLLEQAGQSYNKTTHKHSGTDHQYFLRVQLIALREANCEASPA